MKDKSAAGGGSSTKPANVGTAPTSSSGAGGSILIPLILLGNAGFAGAYYNNMIPDEYLPQILKKDGDAAIDAMLKEEEVKVSKELKEAVEEVEKEAAAAAAAVAVVASVVEKSVEESAATTVPSPEPAKEEPSEVAIVEHPENGNRVDLNKINTFYQTVSEGRAKQDEQQSLESNEIINKTATSSATSDPISALTAAADAMSELQTSNSLENSHTLATAKAALQSDLDATYFSDLEKLTNAQLKVRVVQLATEMTDRTKWEAVRLKEFLSMKEKEVGDQYLEILQKQRLEFESLMARTVREQEDHITRQANAALAAKEENIQSLMKATSDAREQEMKDVLTSETKRIAGDLELEYQQKLQNELAQVKQGHKVKLEGHVGIMTKLQQKMGLLESRLEVSRNYQSGSKKAHRVSAAALALANKLESGEGAAVELAALKGAAGGEGVVASAVTMIPRSAEGGVPTVADLQANFDESYGVGRQAAMVPEGRAGLEGQLLGILFAKLSVPPSADTVPTSEKEGSVTDGVLSLARKYVQLGDIEKAVEQLDKLSGQTAYVMNDWKSMAADRVSTERALKVIKLECALLNKDMVQS